MASIVRYAQYRQFDAERVKINDAVMGLLAGSQLASHFLQLTEGSNYFLADIFPNVSHIARFNLRSDLARDILGSAEDHLVNMAIPYILALHEDYMKHCLDLLVHANVMSKTQAKDTTSSTAHAEFETRLGTSFTPESLELFQILRLMRNCRIHSGGRVSTPLASALAALSPGAHSAWRAITKTSLEVRSKGELVMMGQSDLVAAFALTKRLTDEANVTLGQTYPRDLWADMLVEDMIDYFGKLNRGVNLMQVERRIEGFSRTHYDVLRLTDTELASAFAKVGIAYSGRPKKKP